MAPLERCPRPKPAPLKRLPTPARSRHRIPWVPRLCREPRVCDRHADGEVIQALERVTRETEDVVHRIVVEAADSGAARAGGLGFQIQHLSHHARLPEQMAIERRT